MPEPAASWASSSPGSPSGSSELDEREDELRAETERLEQEQAIWGEATRESRARLAALQDAVDAKVKELAEIEEAHTARAAELDRSGAELDARADRISIAEDELAARAKKLDDREALVGDGEEDVTEREGRLSERETAIAGRDAALDQSEARVAERQDALDQREAELVAREEILAADREQFDRERADREEIMGGAFSRLSELETGLVSSLSIAGMLKRELEGREANERLDRKAPNPPRPEPEGRRGARAPQARPTMRLPGSPSRCWLRSSRTDRRSRRAKRPPSSRSSRLTGGRASSVAARRTTKSLSRAERAAAGRALA